MRRGTSMTEALRRAIAGSGMAHIAIARATGVQRASVMRFMQGRQSLRLDVADRLAAYFGLEVVARPGRSGNPKGGTHA
jgi:plasmid maintenance system antidote protein VapI